MSDLIQFNKFCEFHNGKQIIFCKTDFLGAEFAHIQKLDNEVILISGNSDHTISNEFANQMPNNIKHWFCANNLSDHPRITTVPMGLENSVEASRSGHGVGWPHAIEKEKFISYFFDDEDKSTPEHFIYANFGVHTNPVWRSKIKEACQQSNLITLEQSKVAYIQFINNILSHQAVVCPLGNGYGDNHRIYETLYLNRVPIVFAHNQNILYDKIYSHLPVVLVEEISELYDREQMQVKIDAAKEKPLDLIRLSYWKDKILEAANEH
jgi:hypothetical protein